VPAIRLYRHPQCQRCARFARWHRRLDWLGRFEDCTLTPPPGPLRMGEVMVEDLRSGRMLRGAGGFALLCRQIPAYWLLLPALMLPHVRRGIDREWSGCAGDRCDVR
jgi:hypothetical protein